MEMLMGKYGKIWEKRSIKVVWLVKYLVNIEKDVRRSDGAQENDK